MKAIALKVLSAFVVDGVAQKRGTVVDVPEEDAKDLLRRGKAALDDEPKAEEPKQLDKMNRAELAQMAQDLGLEVADGDTKAQIKAKILEATKG